MISDSNMKKITHNLLESGYVKFIHNGVFYTVSKTNDSNIWTVAISISGNFIEPDEESICRGLPCDAIEYFLKGKK